MLPLYEDPDFTFRFADDRIIPRFHLEGVEAGRQVEVYKIDAGTGEWLGLLTTATVGEGGWVDLMEPIIMRAGDAFVAVPEPGGLPTTWNSEGAMIFRLSQNPWPLRVACRKRDKRRQSARPGQG
jgi:hypothetical protein